MKKRIRRLLLSERGDSSYISSFVYILKGVMHKASLLFIFEPCQGSKVRCLHSAPVRAVRGPPDLVRRLALVKTRISVFMVHKI